MMIALGSDHGGYALKQEVIRHLTDRSIPFMDFGAYTAEAADYPAFAKKVAQAVLDGSCDRGVLLCGTGIGISIAANRIKGIRCALCHDVFSAKATRLHNDANVLAMGGRVIGTDAALTVLDTFLDTPFSGEPRHLTRISMLEL